MALDEAVEDTQIGGYGYDDVQCGNGFICGRNTTGPGICCKIIWIYFFYFLFVL